jgi:glycine cleavage system H protein
MKMNIPDELFFTKDHEWVKIEGGKATMGISDYAQESLGDITFIELPKQGDEVKQSGQCASIESVKAASDVYAPMSGKIIKTNDSLAEKPEIVNRSPYDEAWFAVIEISDESEKKNLMSADEYKKYVEGLQ